MAATTALPPSMRASTGLPSPRSPTLSDFCMILPEADTSLRSISPSPYIQRPPSPPSLYTHANRSERTIRLASAPQARRGPSPQIKSPPLSSKSSRSTLRTMADSDGSSNSKGSSKNTLRKNSPRLEDTLASSPTIRDALSSHPPNEWAQQRRLSNASSSIHSEDLENLRWPGFDSSTQFDDSGVVLEEDDDEEEEHDQFPVDAHEDDDHEEPRRWGAQTEEEYSSAALSRRAELILANAKKRLNVMEGNLRGARESLVVSPTFGSNQVQTDLQRQLAAARERDRKLYAGIGPIPPRIRSYHASPLSSDNSPSHSRGLSETSVPIPFVTPYTSRITPNKRASSAMGNSSGPWSPEGFGQGRFPIRESRSFEVMREPKSNGWGNHEEREYSSRSHESRGSRSPPMGLETLPEDDDGYSLQRPSSTTSDLRSQMDSLKGRISSLKQRAKEDHLRRRSMQNLRTPSPFTSAETWYTEGDAYKSGSPIAADAGVGFTTTSPVRKTLFEEDEKDEEIISSTPKMTSTETSPVQDKMKQEKEEAVHQWQESARQGYLPADVNNTKDAQPMEREIEHDLDDLDDLDDETDFVSVEDEDFDQGGDSVYEDAVYDMPVAERHEDRVDAFDYENFFLHSAMGTYSSASRRSSSSSADSVATTRPVTAIDLRDTVEESSKRISMHQRNSSIDSVSTIASFATAAEEQSDDEENEQMDQFSQRLLPVQQPVSQHYATRDGMVSPRSDSAINMRKAQMSPGVTSQSSRGSSPPVEMVLGLQTTKIYSILVEPHSNEEPRLALSEEEKQLIYSLASSFQQVSALLQSTAGDQYERKEWRRRLDEARRVLAGEASESPS
ncbi:hypothetical protein B0J11DRAFT_259439 [Dendryphion nanum]|uniref:Uncharacterized protein n=1 Tax=Dendryphion nanum TaxID=256645 RepID=A0A9P9E4E8_9PLEO|nr:hypothetical protein B0J11DRAFT_259439 [Dendryphion nanum]